MPTFWFGKGFGDLPDSLKWLRPFAVTGQVGYAIPGISTVVTIDPDTGDANTETNPQVLRWGGRCNTACRTSNRTSSILASRTSSIA